MQFDGGESNSLTEIIECCVYYNSVEVGKNILGIEGEVAWATPGTFTVHNFPCNEDGSNCSPAVDTHTYQDPSLNLAALHQRVAQQKLKSQKKPVSSLRA